MSSKKRRVQDGKGAWLYVSKVKKVLNFNGDQDEGDYYDPKQKIRGEDLGG